MTAIDLRVHLAAEYRIRVQGVLDAGWSDWLGGLAISCDRSAADGRAVTMLHGRLLDQAALFGVLNTLYDLRLPLLSVECVAVVEAV